MSDVISEAEAQQVALGVAFAMKNNDKEGREIVYADLNEASLKRALRWQTRWLLRHMQALADTHGINYDEAFAAFQTNINQHIAKNGG